MKITILGSGTSTGVPMVGCSCDICRSADQRDKRTRASLLIEYDNHTVLVDTSSDLRQQALREDIRRVDAVLFTHAHADHVNGIDDLRGFHFIHKEIIPCYAEKSTLDTLKRCFSYIFNQHDGSGYTPLLAANEIVAPFKLFGQSVVPIPLEHGRTFSTGYRIGDFAYLTDCSAISEQSITLLAGVKVLIIDGLRWAEHPFHFNISGAIAAIRGLNVQRTILTHLTHQIAHSEENKLPVGVELAYDGMKIDLFNCKEKIDA
ncbi:MAG: GPMC system MBL fold metallohydrolase [Desulfuromonadaceae bacterium]|nr:GPMC system MBL fold metallohydrolase [Desulfuromonadaceae bacterium]MDD2856381.1 GPMC system MBL fold metallohydrolase [Desulfuromonadaceae bacterium]